MSTLHSVLNSCILRLRPGHTVTTLGKKPRGWTGTCPRYAALPVCQRRILKVQAGLSGDCCQHDSPAMCTDWHMVLGIIQRHMTGMEPGTVHSTAGSDMSYWQIPHQFISHHKLQNQLQWLNLAYPEPCHFLISCKHRNCEKPNWTRTPSSLPGAKIPRTLLKSNWV